MRTNYRRYTEPSWWGSLTPTGRWVVLALVLIFMAVFGLLIGTLVTPT